MIKALQALNGMGKVELAELRDMIDHLLNEDIEPLVRELVTCNRRLLAVVIVRDLYGIGLLEAKDKVDLILEGDNKADLKD